MTLILQTQHFDTIDLSYTEIGSFSLVAPWRLRALLLVAESKGKIAVHSSVCGVLLLASAFEI